MLLYTHIQIYIDSYDCVVCPCGGHHLSVYELFLNNLRVSPRKIPYIELEPKAYLKHRTSVDQTEPKGNVLYFKPITILNGSAHTTVCNYEESLLLCSYLFVAAGLQDDEQSSCS